MSQDWKVDDREWKKMVKKLGLLASLEVDVGFINTSPKEIYDGMSAAEVMAINEFGAKAHGVNIPARPAIGQYARSLSRGRGRKDLSVADQSVRSMRTFLVNLGNPRHVLSPIEDKMVEGLRSRITGGQYKRNSYNTVYKKGFNHPLVHTGNLPSEVSGRIKTRRGTGRFSRLNEV